jgi:GGDEF domain-containing protein
MIAQAEQILLIADRERKLQAALEQAIPSANVIVVENYFDAIAELAGGSRFSTVLASAEPIERRPEAAVSTLRQLAGDGRLILFGQPSLEPVSRKMLSFGCDDYVVMPVSPGELGQMFGAPPLRLAAHAPLPLEPQPLPATPATRAALLSTLPLAQIMLDAMLRHPHGGPAAAVDMINARIAPSMRLHHAAADSPPPPAPEGSIPLSHPVRNGADTVAMLHLLIPRDEEESAARHFLAQLANIIGKVAALEDRHSTLEKAAITDDLTGLYNTRYFRHFLTRIIGRSQKMRSPVTLLIFDIDGFKTYNDTYGHGVGDEILRQTAALIKKCVRDHDLVARLGGDEFAVVFWEKEGPRQPREPKQASGPAASRIPQTPRQMFQRFQRLLASDQFSILGTTGKGQLTISGAMAVYPYDAQDVNGLIEAADRELVFNAKASGKNCLRLVGEDAKREDAKDEHEERG